MSPFGSPVADTMDVQATHYTGQSNVKFGFPLAGLLRLFVVTHVLRYEANS